MLEKKIRDNIIKNLKVGETEIGSESGKMSISTKKEHISGPSKKEKEAMTDEEIKAEQEQRQEKLNRGKIYSEMLIKLTLTEKRKSKVMEELDEYKKETDKKIKKDKELKFLRTYQLYTKDLAKALKTFYMKDEDREKENLTANQQEIQDKLAELEDKDTGYLLEKYKEIENNPKKEETERIAQEIITGDKKEESEEEKEDLFTDEKISKIFLQAYAHLDKDIKKRERYLKAQKKEEEDEPKPKPEPTPKPGKPEKIKITAAFISHSKEMTKVFARDIADRKMSLGYTPDRQKGFFGKIGNFFKRTWKYGVAREYYRQKEISKAEKEILEKKNLFVDEALSDSLQQKVDDGILDRFVNIDNIDEILHEGEKGKKLEDPKIKEKIVAVIKEYARGKINETVFKECQFRIFEQIKRDNPDIFAEGAIDANNLLETAKGLKASFEHEKGLENIDIDLDIMIGDVRAGARTEQKLSTVDRVIDKMQKTKLGKYINETTLASALAITFGVGQQVAQFLAFNKAAQVASLGGTALLAGGLGFARERHHWEQKRRQHFRDVATGKMFEQKDKQRAVIEKYKYESIDAKSAIGSLEGMESELESIDSPERAKEIIDSLSTLESRIKLSDSKSIDLISYSNLELMEKERSAIDRKRAIIKSKLRKISKEKDWKFNEAEFDAYLKSNIETNMLQLQEGEGGISEKDKQFNRIKTKQGLKAFAKGTIYGLVIGGLVQEGIAFANPNQQGLIEQWAGRVNENATSQTALKHFSDFIQDKFGNENTFASLGTMSGASYLEDRPARISLDQGKELRLDSQGNYSLYADGKQVIDKAIVFGPDGKPLPISYENLKNQGLSLDFETKNITDTINLRTEVSVDQFVESNQDMKNVFGTRDWMRNNTTGVYDFNEASTNLYAQNENFVIDVSNMTKAGSFNQFGSVDITEAIKNGQAEAWISFSRDTSAQVFPLEIGANGMVEITPDSPMFQLFQKVGENKASFNGGFIEIAVKEGGHLGKNAILSTVEGTNSIRDLIINSQVKNPQVLNQLNIQSISSSSVPRFDFPPIIPLVPNRPLEYSVGKVFDPKIETPIKINILRKEKKDEGDKEEKKKEGKEKKNKKKEAASEGDDSKSEKDKEKGSPDKDKEAEEKFEEKHGKAIEKALEDINLIADTTRRKKRINAIEKARTEQNQDKLMEAILKGYYDSLVFGEFEDSKYHETWDYANLPKKDIDIELPTEGKSSWLYRGKKLDQYPVDRCSLNIQVSKEVIDALDDLIINKEMDAYYKIGKAGSNASAEKRRDAITIYFIEKPSQAVLDKIKDLASKNKRKDLADHYKLYSEGFRYTGIGEIQKDHIEDLLRKHKDTIAERALKGFLFGRKSMSHVQFLALQKTLSLYGKKIDYSIDTGFQE